MSEVKIRKDKKDKKDKKGGGHKVETFNMKIITALCGEVFL